MNRESFIKNASKVKDTILAVGGTIHSFEVGEPATLEFFDELQSIYGIEFPKDFVKIATSIAGKVNITWSLFNDKGRELNKKLSFARNKSSIFGGELRWDVEAYLGKRVQALYHNFNNISELAGKLYLSEVSNGDLIMFDITGPLATKPIVYFRHDEDYDTLPQLAISFETYVCNLMEIALVGSEIEQIEYFINNNKGGIDPEHPAAVEWRNSIGLDLDL